jgi:hypothetical protein
MPIDTETHVTAWKEAMDSVWGDVEIKLNQ